MKRMIVMLACVLAIGAVSAQETEVRNSKWHLWIEMNMGVNFIDGSNGFRDYMQTNLPALDYRSNYCPLVQLGVGAAVEYQRFSLGLHTDGMMGTTYSVNEQLVRMQDNIVHLDLGYRFALGKNFSLEPTAGFGIANSEIFISTSRGGTDYVNSFTVGNFVVPLTLNFWSIDKVGLFVQYNICVGQIGKAHITGLETEVDGLSFKPGSLTFGYKCRF